jgi:hypothetical protein
VPCAPPHADAAQDPEACENVNGCLLELTAELTAADASDDDAVAAACEALSNVSHLLRPCADGAPAATCAPATATAAYAAVLAAATSHVARPRGLVPALSALELLRRVPHDVHATARVVLEALRTHAGHAGVAAAALAALGAQAQGAAATPAHVHVLIDAGAAEAAVAAMRAHAADAAVQVSGCCVLIVTACASSRGGVADGAVAAVVAAMRAHARDAELQVLAVHALFITLSDNADAQRDAAVAGVIGAVLAALRAHGGIAHVHLCAAVLTCLAGHCGAEAVARGACEAVSAAMGAHVRSAAVQRGALGALWALFMAARDAPAASGAATALAAAAPRVLRCALDAAEAHCGAADLQLQALSLLQAFHSAALAAEASSDDAHAVTRRMLLAAAAAMRAHPVDEGMQVIGCTLLAHLFRHNARHARATLAPLLAEAVVPVAVAALARAAAFGRADQASPLTEDVLVWSVHLLRVLLLPTDDGTTDTLCIAAAEAGVHRALTDALPWQHADAGVQLRCCELLHPVCACDEPRPLTLRTSWRRWWRHLRARMCRPCSLTRRPARCRRCCPARRASACAHPTLRPQHQRLSL